ncbi:MAG: type III-B CRISPR module RAMP protein Cmr4 [Candidatus Poribacteria bacterium]|nr:MAG: type III-B CRISPR module RAMP protein Cmr4 [Candidatus Poribacteria bacterium]
MSNARLSFVHALSPLHPGTGQGTGAVDLPVAREKATGLPYLPGSSLKGTLRDASTEPMRTKLFGPDRTNAPDHAGTVQITDQRLLLLPVRSLRGTFAWTTSPFLLRRLTRDASQTEVGQPPALPTVQALDRCLTPKESLLCLSPSQVVLEDLDLNVQGGQESLTEAWARWIGERVFPDDTDWQGELVSRFLIVHDDLLGFLLETALEVFSRIALEEDAKTVRRGGLWYEEALPAETVLSGLILFTPVQKVELTAEKAFGKLEELTAKPHQLGGKSTVGRGLCRVVIAKG